MFTKFLHAAPPKLRHEQKFTITCGVYEVLRRRVGAVMKCDEYATESGDYRVTSLYFDDLYGSAYKDKVRGYSKRKKFRIRVYNLSPDRITLEGKYKEGAYINKKSAFLSMDEYLMLLKGDYSFCLNRAEELFHDFYLSAKTYGLRPTAITDYYREAFTADAGNVRITFDKAISAGLGSYDMFKARYTSVHERRTDPDNVVLEIKYDRFLPSYIQMLFTSFPLMEGTVSKYVLCANKTLEVNKICY
ncbi:MAG: polyphosphate polymerase domain-containing protein [Oscillospiraceae bacterium]|nr:polyphosphate polymerase domain-containing protein [Oscillospiraceae bacterium]